MLKTIKRKLGILLILIAVPLVASAEMLLLGRACFAFSWQCNPASVLVLPIYAFVLGLLLAIMMLFVSLVLQERGVKDYFRYILASLCVAAVMAVTSPLIFVTSDGPWTFNAYLYVFVSTLVVLALPAIFAGSGFAQVYIPADLEGARSGQVEH